VGEKTDERREGWLETDVVYHCMWSVKDLNLCSY